jgi:tRNA-2-methylthio-N6-dimethylallyladenosine synthase
LCGTRNLKDLPALLETIQGSRKPVSKIDREGLGIEYSEFQDRSSKIHAYLPIMTGCDKKCTYCIVPLTRGEEISVPMAAVLKQARGLVSKGVKHLTLLGQNVNSYGKKLPAGEDFTRLLRELNSLEELERISFVTSHPEDATEELFRTVADLPKISRRLHLPLQSGSSRILKRMKRGHTIENYIELTQRLRRYVPEISLTTDIIAGFPGETEEDFQATRRALEEIRFDGAFIFKYSPRPGTPASRWEDDVPLSEKKRRNQELLDLQNKITTENNLRLIGRCEAVLVEEPSPKDPAEWLARNIQEKKVVFRAEPCVAGKMVEVRFESLVGDTFRGSYYAA